MSTFVLQIQDLDESGKDWNFAIGSDWLTDALGETDLRAGAEPGSLKVHAQRSGEDILLTGRIEAGLFAQCARCLEDVTLGVGLDVTSLLSPEHTRPASKGPVEVEFDPADPTRDYYSGTEIELDTMVREHLLLEVPMKPLCSESCKGIAIPEHLRAPEDTFGPSAIDARLAPLAKLKDEISKNEE